MSKYKVKERDLLRRLEGFPIEVVQKMLERQVEQGNEEDVKVFQSDPSAGKRWKGFDWRETKEGDIFWHSVIVLRKFDLFFAIYPKNHYVYIYQDGTKKGSDIIETLIRRGGRNGGRISCDGYKAYYYIHPTTKFIKCAEYDLEPWLKTFYTEIDVESSIKEYTMQEIADKLDINVNELRIKK